jgi:hypothetical protein
MESTSLFSYSSTSRPRDPDAVPKATGDFEDLNTIVLSVGNRRPFVLPESLRFDKLLGKGTSFEVIREVFDPTAERNSYYVAVKYAIPAPEAPAEDQMKHRRQRNETMVSRNSCHDHSQAGQQQRDYVDPRLWLGQSSLWPAPVHCG